MGKNKTRLQHNNTGLQAIKVTVEGLPVLPTPQVVTIDGVQHSENLAFESKLVDLKLGDLPYNFYSGSAVILNGEIHILGGGGDSTKHYKFNGTSWTSVSTLPYAFRWSSAVRTDHDFVEIHILTSSLQ